MLAGDGLFQNIAANSMLSQVPPAVLAEGAAGGVGAEGAGGLPFSLLGALGQERMAKLKEIALEKFLDPEFYEALSPVAGLEVVPHTFQATEQEGRWKHPKWGLNEERLLANDRMDKIDPDRRICEPPDKFSDGGYLLTIEIPEASEFEGAVDRVVNYIPGVMAVKSLLNATILQKSTAEIRASWLSDRFEIWGGVAELHKATGFSTAFGHRARVEISGVPFGNYFPASYLLTLSGYINPVGPVFLEFCCGLVIWNSTIKGMYGHCWDRSGRTQYLEYDTNNGYLLKLSDLTSGRISSSNK